MVASMWFGHPYLHHKDGNTKLTGSTSSALGSKSYGTSVPSTAELTSTAKDENPYAALVLETSSEEEGSKASDGSVPVCGINSDIEPNTFDSKPKTGPDNPGNRPRVTFDIPLVKKASDGKEDGTTANTPTAADTGGGHNTSGTSTTGGGHTSLEHLNTPVKERKEGDSDDDEDRSDPSILTKKDTPYAKKNQFIEFTVKMDRFLAKGADGRSVLVNLHHHTPCGLLEEHAHSKEGAEDIRESINTLLTDVYMEFLNRGWKGRERLWQQLVTTIIDKEGGVPLV
jgi:hypothetical protein